MPLHLLGTKSWNVYNASNVARVRSDEAAAAAAEQAAEQRMQEADAARRLAILRGETPPPLPEPEPEIDPSSTRFAQRDQNSASGFSARKRKRAGEDDTDFEMRVARERAEMGERVASELGGGVTKRSDDREIMGKDGHIDLIGATPEEKNAEYEKEEARKKREAENQYTMRFSNAAGRDGFAAGDPWYAKSDKRQAAASNEEKKSQMVVEAPRTNVWGREDPKRRQREALRLTSSDPLAMMKMGAKKVREVERERRKEVEERVRELEELRRDDHSRGKRLRRERSEFDDGNRHRSHRSDQKHRRHRGDEKDDAGKGDRRHSRRSRQRDEERDVHRDRRRSSERHQDRERHSGQSSRSHRDERHREKRSPGKTH